MTSVASRFGRFSLVGFMGALLQLTLVWLLTKSCGMVSTVATPVAVEITIMHNFIWHQRYTWGAQGPRSSRQLAQRLMQFHAGNGLISLAGNMVLVYCLVERLKTPLLPAAAIAIALCSLANFLIADRWVFRSNGMDLVRPLFPGDSRMAGGIGDGLCHQGCDVPVEDRGHDVLGVQLIGRNHRRDGVRGR